MGQSQFSMQASKKFLGTVPFLAYQKQEIAVQNGLPKDYYYKGLLLSLTFRWTAGASTSGTFNAEAGQNLIEMIEINGNHKVLGDYTPYRVPGDYTFQVSNVEDGYNHKRLCSINAGALGAVPTQGTAPLNAGTYDILVNYHISFVPRRIQAAEQLFYLLDAPYWNTLSLYIYWGGIGSLVSGYGGTPTITAYGSAAGSPLLNVTREIVKLSTSKNQIKTIPIKRSVKFVPVTTTQTGAYICDLNKGNLIRSLWFKCGVTTTGTSLAAQGDNFATLQDPTTICNRLTPKRDDIAQRDVYWLDNQEFEAQSKQLGAVFSQGNATATNYPAGYNEIDFCEDNTISTAYNTVQIARNNSRWELWGDITGASNQKLDILTEEVASIPVLAN